jgi:hypothetical protein
MSRLRCASELKAVDRACVRLELPTKGAAQAALFVDEVRSEAARPLPISSVARRTG